jgi:hypothetical protein
MSYPGRLALRNMPVPKVAATDIFEPKLILSLVLSMSSFRSWVLIFMNLRDYGLGG